MATNGKNVLILCVPEERDRRFKNVVRTIRGLGPSCVEVAPNFWYVKTRLTGLEISNKLAPSLKKTDRLFVVDADNCKVEWQNLDPASSDFLRHEWLK